MNRRLLAVGLISCCLLLVQGCSADAQPASTISGSGRAVMAHHTNGMILRSFLDHRSADC